jgi:hypothetical protein
MKKKTRAEQRKPKPDAHSAPLRRQEKSQGAAAEAFSLGRSEALSHTALFDLQRTAGNASVSAAFESPVQRKAAAQHTTQLQRPKVAAGSVSSLFAAEAPELLHVMSAEQIKALQDRFDMRAHNADVRRRYDNLKKRAAASDYPADQAWTRKLDALWSEQQAEPQGPNEVTLPTMAVLDPAILQPASEDGEAEAKFRQSVVEQLLKTPLVKVQITERGLSAVERGDSGPFTKHEIVLECGGMKLPHTKGKVTAADLASKAGSPYAQQYAREVTNSPDVMVFKYQVGDLEESLANAEIEHQDLQARGKEHPIVKTAAEILGGPSVAEVMAVMVDLHKHPEKGTLEQRKEELEAPEPPLDIWKEPKLELKKVNELVAQHHFKLAASTLAQAQRSAAVAFASYERYERRVMKGAGVAVKWLEAAKTAGKLAVGVATGELGLLAQAGLAGAYTFAQGAAERKEGQSVWQLTKESGIEAAMTYLGGGIKGTFETALNERFAAQLVAYPELAERVIKTTSEATASFYKTPIEVTLKHIAAGAKMPSSPEELADMVAKEAFTEIGAGAAGKGEINKLIIKVFVKSSESAEHGKEPARPASKTD